MVYSCFTASYFQTFPSISYYQLCVTAARIISMAVAENDLDYLIKFAKAANAARSAAFEGLLVMPACTARLRLCLNEHICGMPNDLGHDEIVRDTWWFPTCSPVPKKQGVDQLSNYKGRLPNQ